MLPNKFGKLKAVFQTDNFIDFEKYHSESFYGEKNSGLFFLNKVTQINKDQSTKQLKTHRIIINHIVL